MANPTPDDAPEGFWEEFGKFAATKTGMFEQFLKEKDTAPAPEPENDPTPEPPKKKGWFSE